MFLLTFHIIPSEKALKALLSIRGRGAYLISGHKRGGLIRDGGLIERGGGLSVKSYIFVEIHSNFPNFSAPITKTEQEIDFVSPFQ